jgi:hypothetical protein
MRRRSGRGVVALSLVALQACALEEPAHVEEVASEVNVGGPCIEEICGANSPELDLLGFHDLHLGGQANLESFVLEPRNGKPQIIKGTTSYVLHVAGAMVSGTQLQFPFGQLSGSQLVGAYIPIRNLKNGRQYHLVIRGVSPMNYFVPASAPPAPSFEAYTLTWRYANLDYERPVCNNIEGLRKLRSVDYEQAQVELMGLDVLQSVIFEGDRIYTDTKTMEKAADDQWVNIGCAGHTLAKLFLTRNTVHSQRPGIPRPWEQRQATLKMITAAYCTGIGRGYPFTSFGETVVWKGDLIPYFRMPTSLEARWTENGAQCLHEPRLKVPSTELGKQLFKDVRAEINRVCNPVPPPCFNLDVQDLQGKDRISGNPP